MTLKDKEGRTPLHYAAMSKYSLCYLIINFICDYNFFSLDGWEDFLNVHNDIQDLEVKNDRFLDPRKCLRLEKELMNFLGENIISDLKKYFKNQKFKILQHVINTQDNMGDTVLHIAAFHGDYRIVSKLLSYGANKIERNLNNKIPVDLAKDNYVRKVLTNLNTAAKNSDSKNLTELVHFGHDINTKFSIFSQAPLHKVIESKKDDKYSVLRKMLDMGADTSIKDSNGWTALHYACEFNDIESVKILVSQNSNLDDYSNNKRTPLHLAANNGFAEIVRYILESKGSCNFKDHYGCIPLHLAAKQGHVDCIELLLSYGSDLTSEDFRKWNILHYASFHGHSHAVRFIVKYDADNNSLESLRNSQNKLPIEIVKNPLIKPYFISMWHAAKEGNLDMIRQLLNEGEEINEQTTLLRNTPLHLAVFNNHYLLVRLLLEHNADLESRNKDGVTPADYASVINDSIIKNAKNRISNIDIKNEYINLSSIVKNVYNKKEEVINSIISEKNRRVKLWKAIDFSNKIYKMISGGISET